MTTKIWTGVLRITLSSFLKRLKRYIYSTWESQFHKTIHADIAVKRGNVTEKWRVVTEVN